MNTIAVPLEPRDPLMTQAAPHSATATLATLHGWADKGWLRRLDSALAHHPGIVGRLGAARAAAACARPFPPPASLPQHAARHQQFENPEKHR